MAPLVPLPGDLPEFLKSHNPRLVHSRPYVTLTYAQSIDAKIAAKPGTRTTISHLETKTMTHYLRSLHDGILVGSGTALADDPGLNCRFYQKIAVGDDGKLKVQQSDASSITEELVTPRPIILDPWFKWSYKESKLEELCLRGEGKEPWVIVNDKCNEKEKVDYLTKNGGKVIVLPSNQKGKMEWDLILKELKIQGIDMLMVEGGAYIINHLLIRSDLVDSLIITIGSTYLGADGVSVSPPENVSLRNTNWWHGETDSILTANLISKPTL